MQEKVVDMKVSKDMKMKDMLEQMYRAGGFTAKHLGTANQIIEKMFTEKCFNFMSFPSNLLAVGLRGVIKDLVKQKKFQFITTSNGTLGQDIIRSKTTYLHGDFLLDDVELHKKHLVRLGNVVLPEESYGILIEKHMIPLLQKLYDTGTREISSCDLAWEIGKTLDENSVLYWCEKNKIPVVIPAFLDGAVGTQVWMFQQDHKDFKINLYKDESLINDAVWENKKTGLLSLGGGPEKHHVIWWNQFKEGLDYTVYVTTAPEWDGSLSGAQTREAISWGKIKENAKHVTVQGDATVILPLLVASYL